MDSIEVKLKCDSKRVLAELRPHVELALEQELLTVDEAADLIVEEIVNAIEVERG